MKQSVLIIFGGVSSEYDVSLLSAYSVIENIDRDKYIIHRLGITKNGDMFYYKGCNEDIKNDMWYSNDNCTSCIISTNRQHKGIILFEEDENKIIPIDAVFPVMHGKNGEDGSIQGLLSFANIPYVGCDFTSSANCMDKGITHILLDNANIKTAKYLAIKKYDFVNNSFNNHDSYINMVENDIKYPCFVKPAKAGSSVGVSKVDSSNELINAITLAFEHDSKVLVEEAIVGIEVECAILGNNNLTASVIGEIEPCNEFYDYDAKYLANKTVTFIPARIDKDISDKLQELAIKAYKTMGCEGLARVDFFLTKSNEIYLNEINTIPGFTSISMYSQLMQASGIAFTSLITKLIENAIERAGIVN